MVARTKCTRAGTEPRPLRSGPRKVLKSRVYFYFVMPELPEVETIVRGLHASLMGCTISEIEVLWARSILPPDPAAFARALTGRSIINVKRRGKWIVISLDDDTALLIHLRMTGRLVLGPGERPSDRHARVMFSLDDGRSLHFCDQRKFGRLQLMDDPTEVLGELGPEPLADDFTAQRLAKILAPRRGRIKPLLLNQRFLVGLGNIYTDEALWKARLHPLRLANTFTSAEIQRLHQAIQTTLRAAIASGGSTLSDAAYRRVDGQAGEFTDQLAVYGRAEQPCPRCGATIERIRVSQRSTHFCPHCQPSPESQT